jgi:O-antigen/teichoic acid export membrane protein
MNLIKKITKNISVLLISQMLTYVLGFFTLMYTARYLGVNNYGIFSFAMAFTGIFAVFMDLGLNTLTIREVARQKSLANTYIANITLIRILLSFITFLLIMIIAYILGYDQQTIQILSYFTFYTIFTSFSQLFYAVFQANEKMEFQSLGNILSSILVFIGVLMAITYGFNIYQFSLIYVIVSIIILINAIIMFSWYFKLPKLKFERNTCKSLIKEAWPFAVTGVSVNIYLWIDTIILSLIQGQEAVGLYNAAYRLIMTLLFIPVVFNNALFPLMSRYFISSKESLKFMFDKLLKIMILIGLPIGTGTVLIANKLIMLVYGSQFIGAVIALQILIWSTFLIFARSPFERLLESSNKQLSVTKIFILGALFNSILNIIFIPYFTYIGAAVITVLTDILVFGLLTISVKSVGVLISKNTKISLLKIFIASLIMGVVMDQLHFLNLFQMIGVGIIVYLVNLIVMKILSDDEIAMIKNLFKEGSE